MRVNQNELISARIKVQMLFLEAEEIFKTVFLSRILGRITYVRRNVGGVPPVFVKDTVAKT